MHVTKASLFDGKKGALIFCSRSDLSGEEEEFFAFINNILYSIYRVC